MTGTNSVDRFIKLLKQSPPGPVFNPWWEVDEQHDISSIAPMIRRQQLRAYLQQRLGCAKIVIIGEALGYRGGHFSGIAMTSERMLLGKHAQFLGIVSQRQTLEVRSDSGRRAPLQIISGIKPRQTSKPSICSDGFSEPTATIVWSTLLKLGLFPTEFVLWNAFPWHSFDPRRGLLSNRMPNKLEQGAGRPVLRKFLQLFPGAQIIALGKIAAAQLEQLGANAQCIRHPASGGAKRFREQVTKLLSGSSRYPANFS